MCGVRFQAFFLCVCGGTYCVHTSQNQGRLMKRKIKKQNLCGTTGAQHPRRSWRSWMTPRSESPAGITVRLRCYLGVRKFLRTGACDNWFSFLTCSSSYIHCKNEPMKMLRDADCPAIAGKTMVGTLQWITKQVILWAAWPSTRHKVGEVCTATFPQGVALRPRKTCQ